MSARTLISLIVAMDRNRLIGRENGLPWRLPADLKHFKATTLGKPVVMGRKTYESIGRPLPERQNIVISRNRDFAAPGCAVVDSIDAALAVAGTQPEVMIIGGVQLYQAVLPMADRIYLTLIDADFDGDAWFPELDDGAWRETSREDHLPDDRNPYPFSFRQLERVRKT